MVQNTFLVLLDGGGDWVGESRVTAHWVELNVPESMESIPRRVEEKASEIKAEYLAWVHDLGRTPVGGNTLAASLNVLDNLSYWWMTSIATKSPFDSDSLYTVFKLRMLERLYLEQNCSGLLYCGNDQALHQTLQNWCRKLGHPYKRSRITKKVVQKGKGAKEWLRKLPYWCQALAFLVKNWYLRYRHVISICPNRAKQIQKESGATIVNYFPNIDMKKIKHGKYWSRYWGGLHPVLDRLPFKINWVWFYFESSELNFKEAVSLRDACNKTTPEKNQYFFIEEFLTPGVFLQALKLYVKIYGEGLRFKESRRAFSFPESSMNFFPVMEKEWKMSFFGNIAIEGAVRIAMFDCMAKILPATPWGLFTWENLSWDFALISAWRRHRKETQILASQHGFFRPFDLRLYSDSRDFKETGEEAIPLPDKLCVNNKAGMSLLQEAGFPEEKIAMTEALRYFDLKGRHSVYKKPLPSADRTLLVIMGITYRENQYQFQFLNEAAEAGGLQSYSQILVKPHPGLSRVGLKLVYGLNFKFSIKNQPLSGLWPLADVVYGAHSTGASWEASWYGIPAITVSAVNSLNLNPLAGLPGSCFVASGVDLSEQLKNPQLVEIPEDYFFLDEDLKFWKDLLQG